MIYVTAVTAGGDTFHFYTDTGGGPHPISNKLADEWLGQSPPDTLLQGNRSMPPISSPDIWRIVEPIHAPVIKKGWMDQRGKAPISGSLLNYFRSKVDYLEALVNFGRST